MPLHEDDEHAEGNLSDDEYAALLDEMRARAESEGEPPCRMAVPADVLAESLARLDEQGDYRG